MESAKTTIYCPIHTTEPIQRVSLDFPSSKELYCIECLLNIESGVDKSQIKTIADFLTIAGQYYASSRDRNARPEEIPGEYQDILSKQNENLEKLSNHIEQEKLKVKEEFERILETVTQALIQKRELICHELDKQLFFYRHNYAYLEKQLKKAYPQEEDYALYPSKEELEQKYSKIVNHTQLMAFVKNILEDVNETKVIPNEDNEKNIQQIRKNHIKSLVEELKTVQKNLPQFTTEDSAKAYSKIVENLNSTLDRVYILDHEIPDLSTGGSSSLMAFDPKGNFATNYVFSNGNRTIQTNKVVASSAFASKPLMKGRVTTFSIQLGSVVSFIMIGVVPRNGLTVSTCYNDPKAIGYGHNGYIYPSGKGSGLQNFQAKDKVTVTVDLKKGKITYFINKKQTFQTDLIDYTNVEWYPFVYTNTSIGVEATFVKS